MMNYTEQNQVNLALPSLRIDNFSRGADGKGQAAVRKSGLTFAPEAGTQRMRDVINKNINEEEVMKTCRIAFEGGYTAVKLYFMLGLPTETMEDVAGIIDLAQRVVNLFYSLPGQAQGQGRSPSPSAWPPLSPSPSPPSSGEPQDTMDQSSTTSSSHLAETITHQKN